jgi:hypothetical protein
MTIDFLVSIFWPYAFYTSTQFGSVGRYRAHVYPDCANVSLAASGLIWQLALGHPILWQLAEVIAGGFFLWLVRYFYMQMRKCQGPRLGRC